MLRAGRGCGVVVPDPSVLVPRDAVYYNVDDSFAVSSDACGPQGVCWTQRRSLTLLHMPPVFGDVFWGLLCYVILMVCTGY